jgi:hypothetical protein
MVAQVQPALLFAVVAVAVQVPQVLKVTRREQVMAALVWRIRLLDRLPSTLGVGQVWAVHIRRHPVLAVEPVLAAVELQTQAAAGAQALVSVRAEAAMGF